MGSEVQDLLPEEERLFLSNFISDELEQKEDSILCRELHKYTKLQSITDTVNTLEFFNLGLKNKLLTKYKTNKT